MTAATKVADAAHKIVVAGLLSATAFGLYDVTRGFTVMYSRNAERQRAYEAQQAQAASGQQPTSSA
ncbi:hypothetical protein H310_01551 [Aphanomyces invadans]|uniref:Uncharacterized protein n=1 Tax=Aphanomyces invadans TaxID=157072 RepID=A0A024UTV9_9STRA|nr:hypothetical protein H310_01551 [Aphanomyces invadans]ETW09093.1 hypothetical protein H310_01551 [Aphanomyces invadans]|eukprot:XP_008862898.1 hypothetical protein H310_01551 [Aphanomyces invadans]